MRTTTGWWVALATATLLAACSGGPRDAAAPPELALQAGTTVAPDLLSVGDFRLGDDVNGSGDRDTYVDFVFDETTTVASCCARFLLVPVDGGAPLPAIDLMAGDGSSTLTLAFEGTVEEAAIARGAVDANAVRTSGGGSATNNPPQAADVTAGGISVAPDLVSVTRDGDQLLFKFDEALDQEDVIQNTSGLRFYTSSAETFSSSVVRTTDDPAVLRAIYDLPPGTTLDDAVGGYVVGNAVVDPDGNVNRLDEVAPVGDTGAVVCPPYAPLDSEFVEAGPTEAPDLVYVGNFRRGPVTDDFEPTTCVDFAFDQEAYLNGGTRSNFHLVPEDASDALDGSTNVTPESDEPGDDIVTVVFLGDLDPDDFARGYVDTGVVNSACCNVGPASPANIAQSEPIGDGETENPDLVRVSRERNAFLFVFDEPLTDDDVVQNNSGLRIYFPASDGSATIPDAGAIRVEEVDDRTLRAFYSEDLPEGYSLADAVGAFVQQGTVQAARGSRGGNDGTNAFDERFIFGQAFPSLTPVCNGFLATLTGSGKIQGTSGPDVIVGSPGPDTIDGRGGDDVICGRGGDDRLKGDDGEDALFGEAGADELKGQDGPDLLYGGDGPDELKGQADDDALFGDQGDDLLKGERGDDDLFGGDGADDLRGQRDADLFDGGADGAPDVSDYDAAEDRSQTNVP